MDPNPPANATSPRPQAKPLSCTNCRARKLKCSREYPCSHCVRSGGSCVFPVRKRMRKPRTTKNSELLQRLSRLESIVGKVGLASLEAGGEAESAPGPSAGPSSEQPPFGDPRHVATDATEDDWKKALQDSKASQYLSGQFWSSLCIEVEGLRQALESSTDSDDERQQTVQEATPESAGNDHSSPSTSALSSGMLLMGSPRFSYEHVEHPPPGQILFLASTYFTNVDMILKILHRPTIEGALFSLAHAPETRAQLSPEREALFFAIYYAAVASLSPPACAARLGRRREDLLHAYASTIEHLLVQAHYLSNNNIEVIQALTLYTACVRLSPSGSRASWALLSLPIRLAQALSLHRESSHARYAPYEAELRRRLWWQLVVLDVRASEDRGTNTIVSRESFDTRMPLSLDDADFGPDSRGPLVEKPGPTDMTFNLCTARCSGLFLAIEHAQDARGLEGGGFGGADGGGAGPPSKGVEETLRHAQSLEAQFVTDADPNHVPSYLASVMVRIVILKLWLIMQYPLHPRRRPRAGSVSRQGGVTSGSAAGIGAGGVAGGVLSGGGSGSSATGEIFPHEATLRTAISIVELNEFLTTGPQGPRFAWWAETYVQWHPLAVALAELCTQTRGELVERAWRTVEDVFPKWSEVIADTKDGSLWRPIRKLYKKAKAARLAAMAPATTTFTSTAPTTTTTTTTTAAAAVPTTATSSRTGPIIGATTTDDMDIEPDCTMYARSCNLGSGVAQVGADYTMTAQPDDVYGAEIHNAGAPSVPPDLDTLSLSPNVLNESMWGWFDLNLDLPMLDFSGQTLPPMGGSTWDDFVNDTQGGADGYSKSGSSDATNQ